MSRLFLLCLLFAWSVSPVLAEKAVEWQMEQKHYASGDHTFYMTPTAVKIVNKTLGYQVVSTAPKWRVIAFRLDDKVICDLAREKFFKQQGFHPGKNNSTDPKLVSTGTRAIGVVKADVLEHRPNEYWVCHLPGIGKETEDLLAAYFKIRPLNGLVVKSITNGETGYRKEGNSASAQRFGRVVMLETLRIKQVPYRHADFQVPTGLKPVQQIEQIMSSADRRNQAKSIIEELGLGEKFGKKN